MIRTVAIAVLLVAGLAMRSLAGDIPPAQRQSGFSFMSPATQAMQNDDSANPGMLWALDGEALWNDKAGPAGKACADCHQDARSSMRGVAARYPRFDAVSNEPVNLEQRINLCRTRHQLATPLAYESRALLALTTFTALQSRGMAIAPDDDARLQPHRAAGAGLFNLRQGQFNLSCANCHNDNWDKHLAGSAITQAQPTGYPLYRLEWQSSGSLQRRLRACMTGIRAQSFDYGARELVELELYLMSRAAGMPLETPAVRP